MANEHPITTRVADHVGGLFRVMIRECGSALTRAPELVHLAHYSHGLHNFSVDRLGGEERRRDEFVALGRTLSLRHAAFERAVLDVRTGLLVRVVVQSEEGAAICASVQPGDLLVGVVLAPVDADAPPGTLPVQSADIAVATLANRLRAHLRQASYNPGGWETADGSEPLIGAAVHPHLLVRVPGARGVKRAAELVDGALRDRELHFVAYQVDGQIAVSGDTFAAPELDAFFTQIAVDARRRFYLSLSRELAASATSLSRVMTPVPGGRMLRFVLDVEQGAIYYYRLDAGRYLIGVTLDQSRVMHADLHMAALIRQVCADGG